NLPPSPEAPYALEERRHPTIENDLLQSLLSLGTETDPDKLCQSITVVVAHSLVSDLCFLASPPDEQHDIVFESGYDLIREEPFPGFSIKEHNLPGLSAGMMQNQIVHIPAGSDSPDLLSLARSLNLSKAGHVLASPLTNKAGEVIGALVLMTPYSEHAWSDSDQSTLVMIANSVAQILQRHLSQAPYREEISALQQKLQAADQEIFRLSSQIETYESIIGKESSPGGESGSQLSTVQPLIEYDRLDGHQVSVSQEDAKPKGFLAMRTEGNNIEQITGELHLALEEIDRLNKKILELEQADREYLNRTDIHLTSGSESEMTVRIAQELSSPLSSINGYTDFLLAESFGSLGPIQRKFVERIKFSCERINRLLQVTPDSNVTLAERLQLHPELLNLPEIINSAVERVRFEMLEKKLSLEKNLPEDIPFIYADRDALDQILTSLLENAINITPEEGKISLRVVQKEIGGNQFKALIQISDQGGIRHPQTPPQVFTSQPESDIMPHNHGNIDMTMLKELVEMQGGSIWIESEEEVGSTVNVLMPVSAPQDGQTVDLGEDKNDEESQAQTEEESQG
ncbi:MAG: GAF domain-containing sensor histidine kinase, partial [Chloroflexi bacterium]|nr:GAF domain-containing sensor histidine kinase [Chloroflexota bacterium]